MAFTGLLSWSSISSVYAQAISIYTFAQSTETYAQITGTTSTATGDDGSQNAIAIGFTFNFGGANYTTFSVNANGFIRLGANIAGSPWTNSTANATNQSPLIAPFWDDNNLSTGTIRYTTSGSAPNRVLTINWHQFKIGGGGSTAGASNNMLVRLYETTNVVEYVYGATFSTANVVTAYVGINSGSFLSVTPAATSTVSNATQNQNINNTVMTNLAGKKLTFSPPPPCSGTPSPGNTLSSVGLACSATNFTLSLQNATSGTGVTYQWQTSPDGTTWTNAGTNAATFTTSQTAATFYQCIVTCGGNNGTSTPIQINMDVPFNCHCASTGTSANTQITNVTMAGITTLNNTSAGNAGYANFTSVTPTVSAFPGDVVSFSVTATSDPGRSIFIDWNGDGVFAIPAERVFTSAAFPEGTSTGSFTVPPGTPAGSYRIRVVANWFASIPAACNTNINGETEDYTFEVLTLFTCSGTPDAGAAVISNAVGCASTNFSLSATGLSAGTGIEYQWQESATGSAPWTNILGATNSTLATNTATANHYRIRTLCTFSSQENFSSSVSYTIVDCFNVPFTGSNSITTCSGVLYDHGGPSANYANNANGFTVINPTPGNLVQLSGSVNAESGFDFLRIFDGVGTGGTLLYQGSQGAVPVTTSTNGALTVQFTSDGSAFAPGFALNINCIPAPTCLSPTGLISTQTSISSADHSWTASTSSPIGYEFAVTTSATPPASGTFTADTTASSPVLSANVPYYLHVRADCDNGDFSDWATSAFSVGYCEPTYTFGKTDGDLISLVEIVGTTLNNNSGTSPTNPAYTYFNTLPNHTAELSAGTSYTVNVSVGTWGNQHIRAWIDFNDNGIFEPNESIGNAIIAQGLGNAGPFPAANFTISLACNPPVGVHRMRIRSVWSTGTTLHTIMDPCLNYGFGETEDYDVTILPPPACPSPSGLVASNITTSSVTLDWNIGCTETAWELEYGAPGFTPGNGTVVPAATNIAFILGGLATSTTYDVYVRADCDVDGLSSNFGPISVTTLALPPACASSVTFDFDFPCSTTGVEISFPAVADATSYNFYLGTAPGVYNIANPFPNNLPEVFLNNPAANTTFYLLVLPVNSGGEAVGCTELSFTIPDVCPPPVNNLCVNAIPVGARSVTSGTNLAANNVGAGAFCVTGPGSAGVWYSVLGTGGPMSATTCGSVGSFDTKINVYTGPCGAFTCIGGNDDACEMLSRVNFISVQDQLYYIYVTGFGTATGNFTLTMEAECATSATLPAPNYRQYCARESEMLRPTLNGFAEIQWNKNGTPIAGQTNNSLVLNKWSLGMYTATAECDGDELQTNGILVNRVIVLNEDEINAHYIKVCLDANTTLSAPELAGATYEWRVRPSGAVVSTDREYTFTGFSGSFDVFVISPSGCAKKTRVRVLPKKASNCVPGPAKPSPDATLAGKTGIDALGGEVVLSFYPNPVSSNYTIKLNGLTQDEQFNVSWYDIAGKQVSSVKNITTGTGTEVEQSINGLSAGMYMIQVSNANHKFMFKVMVK